MPIKFEKNGHIAYITIDNPKSANIVDPATAHELDEAWREVWEDDEIRVTILTGAGDRHFCAGHDLQPNPDITVEEREFVQAERVFWPSAGTNNGQRLGVHGRMGDHFPQVYKQVIAAVNGWAACAGFYTLLSTADIRTASEENARFKFALLSNG